MMLPLSASDENAINAARQQRWNEAAAAQYAAIRQQQTGVPSFANEYERQQWIAQQNAPQEVANANRAQAEHDRAALAVALGLGQQASMQPRDTWNEATQRYERGPAAPTMGQLQNEFFSRPMAQQVAIYRQGGAPFLDQDQSGMKLLKNWSTEQENSIKSQVGQVGSMIARGEIQPDQKTGQMYQLIDDPDVPGMKKKVPLTAYQKELISRGIDWGLIPTVGGAQAGGNVPSAVPGGLPGGAPIAATNVPSNITGVPATAVPAQSNANTAANLVAAKNGLSTDAATRLGQEMSGNYPGFMRDVAGPVANDISQAGLRDLGNAGITTVNSLASIPNAINRFLGGTFGFTPGQIPEIPSMPTPTTTLMDQRMIQDNPNVPVQMPKWPGLDAYNQMSPEDQDSLKNALRATMPQ